MGADGNNARIELDENAPKVVTKRRGRKPKVRPPDEDNNAPSEDLAVPDSKNKGPTKTRKTSRKKALTAKPEITGCQNTCPH